ncbi:acyl carrier protein [Telmatospirillum sp.]|uniref:acyl carrier protein n=1 Tax=Telmatospirillum sp. TaxID=2079197 RepID=UPI0028452406|nr:acyl carrier protein [Telmatospirillum sp.]MDR3439080.1 acyl carrier protein [Telmatospirillum sp.]
MTLSREQIVGKLTDYLEEMFEIPRDAINSDATLFEDLDLDSIDAIDLVVKLQELTGRRIRPEDFKSVRTVGDIVECVETLLTAETVAGE